MPLTNLVEIERIERVRDGVHLFCLLEFVCLLYLFNALGFLMRVFCLFCLFNVLGLLMRVCLLDEQF